MFDTLSFRSSSRSRPCLFGVFNLSSVVDDNNILTTVDQLKNTPLGEVNHQVADNSRRQPQ